MAKRPRVRSNFRSEHVFRARPPGASPPFFLSSRAIATRNEFTRSRSNRALVALLADDSIAMLNRPLDRAREEVAVGNLFILISVRHKLPTRGEEKNEGERQNELAYCVSC